MDSELFMDVRDEGHEYFIFSLGFASLRSFILREKWSISGRVCIRSAGVVRVRSGLPVTARSTGRRRVQASGAASLDQFIFSIHATSF